MSIGPSGGGSAVGGSSMALLLLLLHLLIRVGLSYLLGGRAERLLQGACRLFTRLPDEAHGFNGDRAVWRDLDFDPLSHDPLLWLIRLLRRARSLPRVPSSDRPCR